MGTSKLLWGQPDTILRGNLRWTTIPSRGSRNTPSLFILQKPEISAGLMGLLARTVSLGQTLSYINFVVSEESLSVGYNSSVA